MSRSASLMIDAVCPVNWQHSLNKTLVSWWMGIPGWVGGPRFADIVDGGRGGNHGAFTNIAIPATTTSGWVPGDNGFPALALDGTDDHVVLAGTADWNFSDFTFVAWFRTANAGSSRRRILSRQDAAGSAYMILGLNANVLEFGSQLDGILTTKGVALNNSLWRHVAVTRDTVANVARWYVDGLEVGSATANGGQYTTLSSNPMIGRYPVTAGQEQFAGTIGGVCVYSTALSAAAVRTHNVQFRLGFPDLLRRVGPTTYFLTGDAPPPSDDYHVTRYTQADLHRAVGSGVY